MTSPDDDLRLAAVQQAVAGVYSLERVLGSGGMGTVYLGRDVALDRPVAIKVLHPELAQRPEARARFLAEARTGARLTHPNIVPIYAVDEASDEVYFVMQLVDGESLASRIHERGPVTPGETERIIHEIGYALAYAHATGIIHRDVTLDNILVERTTGRALLVDFGIAAELERAEGEALIGTPAYIAPELIAGTAPGPRSDLYALGVCAWTMLAGHFPYLADDTAAVLMQHVSTPVPSLLAAAPATPRHLARVVERCLDKAPDQRFADVETLLGALDGPGEQVALAVPLARWIGRSERIRPAWAFAMPMVAMLTMESFPNLLLWVSTGGYGMWPRLDSGDHLVGGDGMISTVLWQMAIPVAAALVLQLAFEFRELRLALRAGYGIDDLRLAGRRTPPIRTDTPPSVLGRVVHDMSWLSIAAIAVMFVAAINLQHLVSDLDQGAAVVAVLGKLLRWSWVLLWTTLGAAFVVPVSPIRLGRGAQLSERFWRSRLGAWVARIASVGLRAGRAPEHTLHRPTELVLELAIDDLWSALPDASRRACAELPEVAESLRQRVSETRDLLQQLATPELARMEETATLRERLASRQTMAITALEQLRLQLMQLTGSVAPTGALTQHLRDARSLERALLSEFGAHPSVGRLLDRAAATAPTSPTPQPA